MSKHISLNNFPQFYFGRTLFISIVFLFIALPNPIRSQELQPLLKPIYVQVLMHYEDFINPKEAAISMERTLNLFERHNIRLSSLEIRGITIREANKAYPKIIEAIKRTKTAINGNQETHIRWPASNINGLSWDESVRKILDFETCYLSPYTGTVDKTKRNDGWLAFEQILGITPIAPCIGSQSGVSGYVLRQLKLTGAKYTIPQKFSVPTDGMTLSFGDYFIPEEAYGTEDKFYAFDDPYGVPNGKMSKQLEYLIERFPVRSIRVMIHNQGLYLRDLRGTPSGANGELYSRAAGQAPVFPVGVLYSPPIYPDWKIEAVFNQFEDLISYMAERPEIFKFYWADPEDNQYNAGPIPERDYRNFPWVRPQDEARTLSKAEYLKAAESLYGRYSGLPSYIDLGKDPSLTLAETYFALAQALKLYKRNGRLPESIDIYNVLGPVDFQNFPEVRGWGMNTRCFFDGKNIVDTVEKIGYKISDRIPGEYIHLPVLWLKGEWKQMVNPAEMLYLMAEQVHFINTKGKPSTGFWRPMGVYSTENVRAGRVPHIPSLIYDAWNTRKEYDPYFYDIGAEYRR